MDDHPVNALSESLRHLRAGPAVGVLSTALDGAADAITAELVARIRAEIPAFSETRNPDVPTEMAAHVPRHVAEMSRLFDGGEVGDFDFVREHARRRAEQHFPLEATLHAYRCGHKVFSHRLRGAVAKAGATLAPDARETAIVAVVDFTLDYTDAISTVYAGTYLRHSKLVADVAGDRRAQLLTLLLDGYDESDRRVADVLRDAGYLGGRRSFCVALAQPFDAEEMESPERARRLVESIEALFRRSPIDCLVDVRERRAAIVFSALRRTSGWTRPERGFVASLGERLDMLGNAVRVGIGEEVVATALVPGGYRQAEHALQLADREHRVMRFADLSAARLLMHVAGDELARMLPSWAPRFAAADDERRGTLLATLEAYADADMNAQRAAKSLALHPNTLYARFARIREASGLEPTSYRALTELLLVGACLRRQSARAP